MDPLVQKPHVRQGQVGVGPADREQLCPQAVQGRRVMPDGLREFRHANRWSQGRKRAVPEKEGGARGSGNVRTLMAHPRGGHGNAASVKLAALGATRGARAASCVMDRGLRGTPLSEACSMARMAARNQHLCGVVEVRHAHGAGSLGVTRRPVGNFDRVSVLPWQACRISRGWRNPSEAVSQALHEDASGDHGFSVREAGLRPNPFQEVA